jgi:PAS domain S-box-containing protein
MLFTEGLQRLGWRTDRLFGNLLIAQWVVAIVVARAANRSPAGAVLPTDWGALAAGLLITVLPGAYALFRAGRSETRYVVATAQGLISAWMIHLSDGHVETHFHEFGSLVFLALYRDVTVLGITAILTILNHLVGGFLWPASVYGANEVQIWPTIEHTGWLCFELVLLLVSIENTRRELSEACSREAAIETASKAAAVASRALRESEFRFRALVEGVKDHAIFMLDPDGFVCGWNNGAERLLGYSVDDVTGQHLDLFYPEASARAGIPSRLLDAALQNGFAEDEGWQAKQDGTRFWAIAVASAIRSEEKNLVGYSMVVRDFTERRQAEEALAERARNEALAGDVGRALTSPRSLDACLERCARAMVEHLGAASARIWTVSEDGSLLEPRAVAGPCWEEEGARNPIPIGKGRIGRIAKDWEAYCTNEAQAEAEIGDLRWVRERDLVAFAGYPLKVEGNLVGVMAMYCRQPITSAAESALAAVSGLMAVGIAHKQAGEAVTALNASLERRVSARTAELAQTLQSLQAEIAERRRAEAEIQELSAVQNAILDSTNYTIVSTTPDGTIRTWNAAAEAILGFNAHEMVGRESLLRIHDSAEVQRRGECLSQALGRPIEPGVGALTAKASAGIPDEAEWTYLRKDGTPLPVLLSITALRDGSGNITGYLVVGSDLTERKRADQQQALLASIVASIDEAMVSCERDGGILSWNAGAERMFGYTEAEVIGKPSSLLVPAERLAEEQRLLAPCRSGAHTVHFESIRNRKNGTQLDVSVTVSPIREPNGEIHRLAMIVRDNSVRKRMERMKNEFIATVSHELRTPLTSIRGSLGLIAGGVAGALPDKATSLIKIALTNCERLVRLINDILDIEKIEAGKMEFRLEALELQPLIEKAITANDAYAMQFGVRLELTEPIGGVMVNADPDRLHQVLTNLLSNATKYSPRGDAVRVAMAVHGGRVRVSVSDRGPGIPEEFRKKVFEKFGQVDSSDSRQKGGTGLGLPITRAIAERHGGTVDFTSVVGEGTTFYVELPEISPAAAGETADAGSGSPGTTAGTAGVGSGTPPALTTALTVPALSLPRLGSQLVRSPGAGPKPNLERTDVPAPPSAHPVLVCEDDPDIAHLISEMLGIAGFRVETVHTLSAARERLKTGSYQALTLDLQLPDGNGTDFVRELRQAHATRDLPVLVISAHAEAARLAVNGDVAGILDWHQKPIDPERLISTLRTTVQSCTSRQEGVLPRILHVEDDPDIRQVVQEVLNGVAEVVEAADLRAAREALSMPITGSPCDLVLLDLGLPDGSGLSLLPSLRSGPRPIPAVIFSANEVSPATEGQVAAVLLKSKADNLRLIETVRSLVAAPVGIATRPETGSEPEAVRADATLI